MITENHTKQGEVKVKVESEHIESPNHAKQHPRMLRNVLLLSICSAFGFAAAFSQISTTSLAAKELNGPATSTIPLGALLLSAALTSSILPRMVARYGAKPCFISVAIAAAFGALVEFLGLYFLDPYPAFILLCLGAVPQGFSYSAVNYFRLAAVEFCSPDFVPKAMSIVIGGGLFSAVLGPELVKHSRVMFPDRNFSGTYLHIAALHLALALTLALVEFAKPEENQQSTDADVEANQDNVANSTNSLEDESTILTDIPQDQSVHSSTTSPRTVREIVLSRKFLGVMYLQAVAFSTMGALMAATPVSMADDGFSFSQSTTAIIAHMLGMYVPSIFSGEVVKKFKPYPVALFGFVVLTVGAVIFLTGRSFAHYLSGITLVGVGWNFAFVPMSAVLSTLYTTSEKAGCQAVNEVTVIGILGVALFTTGFLYAAVLWDTFVIIYIVYTLPAILYILYELVVKGTRG